MVYNVLLVSGVQQNDSVIYCYLVTKSCPGVRSVLSEINDVRLAVLFLSFGSGCAGPAPPCVGPVVAGGGECCSLVEGRLLTEAPSVAQYRRAQALGCQLGSCGTQA